MSTVYRLEHKYIKSKFSNKVGTGCYVDFTLYFDWYSQMLDDHCDENHPNIWVDGLMGLENHFCCFPTLVNLKNWFGKYLELLMDEGFIVVKYELNQEPKLGKSGLQGMFHPSWITNKEIVNNVGEINLVAA